MEDFWDFMKLVVGFCMGAAVVILTMILIIWMVAGVGEYRTCSVYKNIYQTETYFSWVAGCYVKYDDKFLPRQTFDTMQTPNTQFGNAEFNVNIKKD